MNLFYEFSLNETQKAIINITGDVDKKEFKIDSVYVEYLKPEKNMKNIIKKSTPFTLGFIVGALSLLGLQTVIWVLTL